MTTLESKKAQIPHPRKRVFEYLGDFRNFEKLMPADRISDWEATKDTCSFKIIGMATISMAFEERIPDSKLRITSTGKTPIPFRMIVLLDEAGETSTEGQVIMEADMNPMIKMMAERPLTNFLDMLAERLPDLPIHDQV